MAVVRVIAQALLDDSRLIESDVETSATTPVRKFIGVKPVLVKNCRGVTLGRAAVSFKAQATSTAANMIRTWCCIRFFFSWLILRVSCTSDGWSICHHDALVDVLTPHFLLKSFSERREKLFCDIGRTFLFYILFLRPREPLETHQNVHIMLSDVSYTKVSRRDFTPFWTPTFACQDVTCDVTAFTVSAQPFSPCLHSLTLSILLLNSIQRKKSDHACMKLAMGEMRLWRAIPLLVCVILCGSSFALLSAAGSSNETSSKVLEKFPWLCEWLGNKTLVRIYAMSVHTNLVREYRKLNEERGRLVTDIADAGAVSQLEIVSEAQYNADVKFWEVVWLKNEACSAIESLVGVINAWKDTLFEGKNAHRLCNSSFMRAEHNASHSFAVLYAELAKNVANFSAFSNSHNASHYHDVKQKIDSVMETLKEAEKLSVLAAEAKSRISHARDALEKGRRLHTFNQGAAFVCEVEKRMNIMKDTFVALESMLNGVLARADVLLRRTVLLQMVAVKLGQEIPAVEDAQLAKAAATTAMANVSSALLRIISAMHGGTQVNLRSLLKHGHELQSDVLECKSDKHLERSVLLRVVADEHRSHFEEFEMWRDATAALWESVTDVRSPQHLDCNNFGDAECKAVLSQVNELMEVGRQARTAAEARLSDAISVLVTVEQQINKGKALLESVLGVDNGTLAWNDANATLDGLEEAVVGGAEEDDGAEHGGGGANKVNGASRTTSIVLVVVVPTIIAGLAIAVTWFVLRQRRRRENTKDPTPFLRL
ncbi:hypothetical protein ERJ75_000164400 [Trypanosoma vivax]|nr:hypothetical protein ERJ75_000164400 [Trypanosoma vivax]